MVVEQVMPTMPRSWRLPPRWA